MSYEYGKHRRDDFLIADLEREETALMQALERVRYQLRVHRAKPVRPAVVAVARVEPCGTYAAYMRHYRRGEEACARCKDAYNAYRSSLYVPSSRPLSPCGTYAAYARHLRHGEKPCEPCKRANTIYCREKREKMGFHRPVKGSRSVPHTREVHLSPSDPSERLLRLPVGGGTASGRGKD